MSIKPVSTTMGQQSLAGVSGVGWYRYNGDKPAKKGTPSEPLPQNRKATSAKEKRMAEYNRLRLDGASKEEAAAGCAPQGVSKCTMHYYEREFVAQHPEAGRDG